uniref:Uncharacterized protein n=1 Tax=Chlorocebus sabaeus TaxID=60711 RepID=A0A0D9R4A6_CHLSB
SSSHHDSWTSHYNGLPNQPTFQNPTPGPLLQDPQIHSLSSDMLQFPTVHGPAKPTHLVCAQQQLRKVQCPQPLASVNISFLLL